MTTAYQKREDLKRDYETACKKRDRINNALIVSAVSMFVLLFITILVSVFVDTTVTPLLTLMSFFVTTGLLVRSGIHETNVEELGETIEASSPANLLQDVGEKIDALDDERGATIRIKRQMAQVIGLCEKHTTLAEAVLDDLEGTIHTLHGTDWQMADDETRLKGAALVERIRDALLAYIKRANEIKSKEARVVNACAKDRLDYEIGLVTTYTENAHQITDTHVLRG